MKLDEALQVLADLFEEQDMRWLTELAVRRNQLTEWLQLADRHGGCECQREDESIPDAYHERTCDLGVCLRAVGGSAEIKRQTNGAHEEALLEVDEQKSKQAWNDRREADHRNRT